ncbi:caspase-8 isoform X2 [Xiphias gladius]|uniref:caspase-8 isoform X2 n=1 Tax=Xiphias gladius TaxID=8245 RepID=UPI001A9A1F29|nr:caspase-8 isoform X2 [Xiphias gladius]
MFPFTFDLALPHLSTGFDKSCVSQEMDFQRLLLKVGKALGKDEVKALAFLCTELLGRNPNSVESASDLFSRLADQDYLSHQQPHLLTELLLTIQRTRLVRDLNLTDRESTTISLISPYRKLLYSLSEEITDDDLKHVKFLLNTMLPRRRLEEKTVLEVFLEMEHMDLLSDTNLNELEKIIQSVCPMLKDKINQFKSRQAPPTSPIPQQIGQPRSNTYPCQPNQVPLSLDPERTERPALGLWAQCSMNSSNTSVDFHSEDECGALSHGLRDLSTETSSCASLKENVSFSEKQTFQTTNTNNEVLGIYPMTAAKRGICLIINNYNFTTSTLKNREGTMADEMYLPGCLCEVFMWLGFEIKIEHDCTSEKMLSVLRDLGRRDHSQMDCVVCCVLSHGNDGGVYGVDGQTVKLMELMESLNGLKCPSLAEKPKLFFIQACQGTSEQRAVYIEADGPARSLVCSDAIEAKDSIPTDADFLQAMATVPSCVSFRERKNGTWFIQSLCQNLVQMVPRGYDLVSILTKVNADVSLRTDFTGEKKQMPQPAFSLRKKVVFPIPKAPPPSQLSV